MELVDGVGGVGRIDWQMELIDGIGESSCRIKLAD
jgi:hypothetical protein